MSSNITVRQRQKEVLERLQKESVEIVKRRGLRAVEPKIAVTAVGYDDIGSILEKLDYKYTLIRDHDISQYDTLKKYNNLFVNCGTGGDPIANKESLGEFVRNGGVLYVSDRSAPQISMAFPNYADFSWGGLEGQRIKAKVMDQDLARIIGPCIEIYFDLPDWVYIERLKENVHIYLEGSFRTASGLKKDRPILISFIYGTGEVIYTSFHNREQVSEVERDLLKFLVLKPISIATRIPILDLAKSKGLIALEHKELRRSDNYL